jgi:L-glutamine---4-(methylsulfanyl)-2-oxobutanoate aminotransferase
MRAPPARVERLPDQYFFHLLARVAAAAQAEGDPVVDLGRGNPEVGPPPHVVERLAEAARDPSVHGYPPFRGLPALKEAIAARYSQVYGVELDPEREVCVVPGTKSSIVELVLVLAEEGSTVLLPDPGYPDYNSGIALAAARTAPLRLDASAGWRPDFESAQRNGVSTLYLNYPSNPCACAAPEGAFADAVRFARETDAWIVHDFAYGDVMFDGRRPQSFLAEPGALEVGVEMFSMSKTYGMAGWRLGFVVGNPEIVERLNLLQDHIRIGIFTPLQHAGIAALTGPQGSVAKRVARYEQRRDRTLAALAETRVPPPRCEGTFYVWIELPDSVTPDSLLLEHRIAIAPGEGFGPSGRGWGRLSLAISDEQLDLGLERLRLALS